MEHCRLIIRCPFDGIIRPICNDMVSKKEAAGINLHFNVRLPRESGQNDKDTGIVNSNVISYIDILRTIHSYTAHPSTTSFLTPSPRTGRSFLPIFTSEQELPDWAHVFASHTFREVTSYSPKPYLWNGQYKDHRNIAPPLLVLCRRHLRLAVPGGRAELARGRGRAEGDWNPGQRIAQSYRVLLQMRQQLEETKVDGGSVALSRWRQCQVCAVSC